MRVAIFLNPVRIVVPVTRQRRQHRATIFCTSLPCMAEFPITPRTKLGSERGRLHNPTEQKLPGLPLGTLINFLEKCDLARCQCSNRDATPVNQSVARQRRKLRSGCQDAATAQGV